MRTKIERNRLETLSDEMVIAAFRNGFLKLNRAAVAIAANVEECQVGSWVAGLNVNEFTCKKIENAIMTQTAPVRGKFRADTSHGVYAGSSSTRRSR